MTNKQKETKKQFIEEFHAIFGHEHENNIDIMWNWIDRALSQREEEERKNLLSLSDGFTTDFGTFDYEGYGIKMIEELSKTK
jgi:hypothetical protein